MNNAGSKTHKARAVDPKTFRDAATGVGQAFDASVATGAVRAQRAINCAPASQRAVADPSYPAPTLDTEGNYLPAGPLGVSVIASPVQLKRAGR